MIIDDNWTHFLIFIR